MEAENLFRFNIFFSKFIIINRVDHQGCLGKSTTFITLSKIKVQINQKGYRFLKTSLMVHTLLINFTTISRIVPNLCRKHNGPTGL